MKYLGVSSWRGWGVTFSDGMCTDCAGRARAEWRLPATAVKAVPVPRARRSLRPDFALAAAVLLLTLSVAFGVMVGPPPRTVSQPPAPATNLASLERADTTVGGARPGATTAPSSSLPTERGPAASSDRVAASGPTGAGAEQVAEAPAEPDRSRVWPIRVARASARRPSFVAAAYQPLPVVTVEFLGAPDLAVGAPVPAPAPLMVAALAHIEVQAP